MLGLKWISVSIESIVSTIKKQKLFSITSCFTMSQVGIFWNILLGRKQDLSKSSIFFGVSYTPFYVSSTTLLFIFHFFLYWLTSETDEINSFIIVITNLMYKLSQKKGQLKEIQIKNIRKEVDFS